MSLFHRDRNSFLDFWRPNKIKSDKSNNFCGVVGTYYVNPYRVGPFHTISADKFLYSSICLGALVGGGSIPLIDDRISISGHWNADIAVEQFMLEHLILHRRVRNCTFISGGGCLFRSVDGSILLRTCFDLR